MSLSPNIRLGCGETAASSQLLWLGGCFNMSKPSLESVQKLTNTTKVPNYAGGGYINPYERPEQLTAPDCSPYNNGGCPDNPCYHCGDGINNNPYCGMPMPTDFLTCITSSGYGQIEVAHTLNGAYYNCYSSSRETRSYSHCEEVGSKTVYAHKVWNGRKGFNSRDLLAADNMRWCCSCGYHAYDDSPDIVKYLSIAATYSDSTTLLNNSCTDPDPITGCTSFVAGTHTNSSRNASSTVHIDKFGNLYVDGCSSGSSGYGVGSDFAATYAFGQLTTMGGSDITTMIGAWCGALLPGVVPTLIAGSGTSWQVQYSATQSCQHADCSQIFNVYVSQDMTIDLAAGTMTILKYGEDNSCNCGCPPASGDCNSCCNNIVEISKEQWIVSKESFDWLVYSHGYGTFRSESIFSASFHCDLATPYTSKQAQADAVDLLRFWDLGNNGQYPWRRGGDVTRGPLMSYDEGSAIPYIGTCTGSILYSGQIQGKPGPIGIDKIWNPLHKNYCICDSLVSPGCLSFYQHSWGAWSTDIGVPCATQWTDDYTANNMVQGAFLKNNLFWTIPSTCGAPPSNSGPYDDIWVAKYAEVLFPKESFNYFRPCGEDRFSPALDSNRCVASVSDHTLTLDNSGAPTNINTGDYVWVCGIDTSLNGCWKANKDSDYQITLHDQFVSASWLSIPPIESCGTGVITKLRWQTLQPAICGRINISAASETAPIVVTLEDSTYLGTGDKVNIVNAKGSNINGSWTVSVVDEKHISLNGSNGVSQSAYIGSGQIFSPFTPDWKWNDTLSKGDYTVVEWHFNYRDIGEYNRLASQQSTLGGSHDCSSDDPSAICPYNPGIPFAQPRPYQSGCGLDQNIESVNCSTYCLPFTPCVERVAFWSPDKESFDPIVSRNHGFPTTNSIDIDNVYGTGWQGMVKQSMTDPFWQVPPCTCVDVFDDGTVFGCDKLQAADDGHCLSDDDLTEYYAFPPQFEARCEIPTGAPPAIPGEYFGCLTVPQLNNPVCPNGYVCIPPFAYAPNVFENGEGCGLNNSYIVYPWAIPWVYKLNETACVCGNGRFASDYENNGIVCDHEILSPPF